MCEKKEFEVLLTATLQKKFVVEACDKDEACAILEKRWQTGVGGEIRHDELKCTDVQFDATGE